MRMGLGERSRSPHPFEDERCLWQRELYACGAGRQRGYAAALDRLERQREIPGGLGEAGRAQRAPLEAARG